MNDIIAFTIVARNYLAYSKILAISIKKTNPNVKFNIVVIDLFASEELLEDTDEYHIFDARDIGINNYEELAYKYDITEFATSVKPFCFDYFFNRLNAEKVLYIDPDICVFDKLDKILSILDESSLVLTPHIINPQYYNPSIESGELVTGVYNLGFVGISNTKEGKEIIKWWEDRLNYACYDDTMGGLYTDQKWMNFAPALFNKIHVLRDYSYNVAWWNFHEREIVVLDNKYMIREGDIYRPIVFFHFSGYKVGNKATISKDNSYFSLKNQKDIEKIFEYYDAELEKQDAEKYSGYSYGYNTYDNGYVITRLHRRLYRVCLEDGKNYVGPFDSNGEFYKILSNNGLIIKSKAPSAASLKKDNIKGLDRKARKIQMLLKIGFYILGPQRYEQLIKYLQANLVPEKQIFLIKEK